MSVDESLRAEQYRDASNLNARIALHEQFSTNPHGLPLWIFDQLELPDDARILEIGCGSGNLWAENTKHIPEGWQITLTDASPGMICEAQRRLSGSHSFRFEVANAQELPFANESFDAVIADHMLYHVPDRDKAFSEIVRILRHGGHLYAVTNGIKHTYEMVAMLRVLDPEWSHESISTELPKFNLQNGAQQLSPWFNEVALLGYEDSLAVTEAKPLVDYLLSTMHGQELAKRLSAEEFRRRLSTLKDSLAKELAARGSIHITKDTGMFVASC
jgi:SAM-dependent methyltransferase